MPWRIPFLRPSPSPPKRLLTWRVVDFIAQDLDDLLTKLDGMSVTIEGREQMLATRDVQVKNLNMSLIDRFLFIIADPNISFILLSVGGLAIVVEIFNPGLIFPGLTGVIFLVMAFISLGNLPVNWARRCFDSAGCRFNCCRVLRGGIRYIGHWGHHQPYFGCTTSVCPFRIAISNRAILRGKPSGYWCPLLPFSQ